uniref:Uncharacterized protein n=1 Tax=Knipowitschia caucasica TaxID=637954 RepID=A0AAV2KV32_KNICA
MDGWTPFRVKPSVQSADASTDCSNLRAELLHSAVLRRRQSSSLPPRARHTPGAQNRKNRGWILLRTGWDRFDPVSANA